MRCHDILSVKENADLAEIDRAYSSKVEALEQGRDVLAPIAFARKLEELAKARDDCKAWKEKGFLEKTASRMDEGRGRRSGSDVRLNTVCFGPCTCMDQCCGSAVSGSPVDSSCCVSISGSQKIPIVCDALILGPIALYIAFHVLVFIFELISDVVASSKSRKQDRVMNEIATLRSRLSPITQKRKAQEEQLKQEMETLEYIGAFADTFASLGASDVAATVRMQRAKTEALETQILRCLDQENTLRSAISNQERKL